MDNQRTFLSKQLLKRIGFILIWILFFYVSRSQNGDSQINSVFFDKFLFLSMELIAIVTLGFYLWTYGKDMLLSKPFVAAGEAFLYQKRFVRTDQYWIRVNSQHIRTTKEIWQMMRSGKSYKLWYAPATRWLLAWQENA